MRFHYFSILLRNSSLVIGNSSLGVREAPFLGIPSINVGSRQTNRSSSKSISNINLLETNSIKILSERSRDSYGRVLGEAFVYWADSAEPISVKDHMIKNGHSRDNGELNVRAADDYPGEA